MVSEELCALERRLAGAGSVEEIAHLLADEFREVGASGRVYDKAEALAVMAGPARDAPAIDRFEVRALGPDHALVTYCAVTARGASWRSSIWARRGDDWQIVFHQGTPARVRDDVGR